MFDFEKPGSRGYTETITTLARMARFIIADLTDAAEVRLELAKIVPDLPSVPVQPLVLASATEYVTFDEIRRYPWVLEPFRYEGLDHAIASLPELVLTPAEAKVRESDESGSLVRGRRDAWSLAAGFSDPPTAGFVVRRCVQGMHRAIGFVDRLVDSTFLVKPPRVKPPPASMKKVKHRPDSVPERFGLLGG